MARQAQRHQHSTAQRARRQRHRHGTEGSAVPTPHSTEGAASPPSRSVEPALLQVVFDDDVRHGVKHELHVLGVGGAGEVRVDLLGVFPPVQVLELALDVRRRLLVRVGA